MTKKIRKTTNSIKTTGIFPWFFIIIKGRNFSFFPSYLYTEQRLNFNILSSFLCTKKLCNFYYLPSVIVFIMWYCLCITSHSSLFYIFSLQFNYLTNYNLRHSIFLAILYYATIFVNSTNIM